MERVRERSGVGKATIYRRYGSKEELVSAAIVHLNSDIPMPPDTGSLLGDFAATARRSSKAPPGPGALTLMPRLLSEVVGDPEMHALFSRASRRAAPARRARRSSSARKARGEVRAEIDPDLAVDLMVGPIIYRVIISGGDPAADRRPRRGPRHGPRRASGLGDLHAAALPTPSVRRPASSSSSSAPTSSRRQPCSVRTSGSGWPRRAATTTGERSARAAISS